VSFALNGVELRTLDVYDRDSVAAALQGVDRLIFISLPGTELKSVVAQQNTIDEAVKAGVKHVIYTSVSSPTPNILLGRIHYFTESRLAESPKQLGYTILRNHLYQEFLLYFLASVVKSGIWNVATGDQGRRSPVSRSDLAKATAIAALNVENDTSRRFYDLSGPEWFTMEEIAAMVSEVFSRPIKVVQHTEDELTSLFQSYGFPAEASRGLAELDTRTRVGYDGIKTDHLAILLGHEARTLREFFEEQKAIMAP
jgi:NAD(P)H dehydrogenase (quinone)